MTFLLPAHKHTEYYYVSWRYMSLCISDAKLKRKTIKKQESYLCVHVVDHVHDSLEQVQ